MTNEDTTQADKKGIKPVLTQAKKNHVKMFLKYILFEIRQVSWAKTAQSKKRIAYILAGHTRIAQKTMDKMFTVYFIILKTYLLSEVE